MAACLGAGECRGSWQTACIGCLHSSSSSSRQQAGLLHCHQCQLMSLSRPLRCLRCLPLAQEIVDEGKLISVKPQAQHVPGVAVDDDVEKTYEVRLLLRLLRLLCSAWLPGPSGCWASGCMPAAADSVDIAWAARREEDQGASGLTVRRGPCTGPGCLVLWRCRELCAKPCPPNCTAD